MAGGQREFYYEVKRVVDDLGITRENALNADTLIDKLKRFENETVRDVEVRENLIARIPAKLSGEYKVLIHNTGDSSLASLAESVGATASYFFINASVEARNAWFMCVGRDKCWVGVGNFYYFTLFGSLSMDDIAISAAFVVNGLDQVVVSAVREWAGRVGVSAEINDIYDAYNAVASFMDELDGKYPRLTPSDAKKMLDTAQTVAAYLGTGFYIANKRIEDRLGYGDVLGTSYPLTVAQLDDIDIGRELEVFDFNTTTITKIRPNRLIFINRSGIDKSDAMVILQDTKQGIELVAPAPSTIDNGAVDYNMMLYRASIYTIGSLTEDDWVRIIDSFIRNDLAPNITRLNLGLSGTGAILAKIAA